MHLTTSLLLFVHLIAVTFWVGGMAVMHFAVRPAAVVTLEPPQRLPFMAGALSRFFVGVSIAVAAALVHGMFTVGLVMMALFLHIRFAPYARLQRAVAAREWPVAAAQLGSIRKLVAVNLLLGVGVYALAVIGRAF
jgi:uncharacterized membrane protein